jgi:hypothetical protein
VEPIILHDARVPPEPTQLERFAGAFPTHGYQSEDERQRPIERRDSTAQGPPDAAFRQSR